MRFPFEDQSLSRVQIMIEEKFENLGISPNNTSGQINISSYPAIIWVLFIGLIFET
jgi:hypothetical protein